MSVSFSQKKAEVNRMNSKVAEGYLDSPLNLNGEDEPLRLPEADSHSAISATSQTLQSETNAARDWARLAKQAGQKYMVMAA